MNADLAPVLPPDEALRERLLDYCKSIVDDMGKSKDLRRAAFTLMEQLIKERPPERVREIEIERGLAR